VYAKLSRLQRASSDGAPPCIIAVPSQREPLAREAMKMSWFRKGRRLNTSPIMIAELLHQIMVEEDYPHATPETFHLPEAVHARFREKVFLYREANILLALLVRAKEDKLFEPPLREYERILFPQSPNMPPGAARLQAVRAAMQGLRVVMDPSDSRQLTWARNWFADIGHDETNPLTLTLFFTLWADLYIAAHESLEGMIT
jgi:hypothetical protein